MQDIISGIITSKLKIKMLMRFFLNPETELYLRELAGEFDVSSNAVRIELNRLAATNLVTSRKNGRKVLYRVNPEHPLFPEISSMVKKILGVDELIESVITRLGGLEEAYLIDDYAQGKDSGIIDMLLVGKIDNYHLQDLSKKTEQYLNRKVRYLILGRLEFEGFRKTLKTRPHILIWKATEENDDADRIFRLA